MIFPEDPHKTYIFLYLWTPGQGVGCRCWNILTEHNRADVWKDAQRSLETIADEEETEIFLIKIWLKFNSTFCQ